jgi:hypothetical protein
VGLVVEGPIEITVPFLAPFALGAVSFLASIFNPVTCISVANDVTQVSPVSIPAALLRWSDVASRVPVCAWAVVMVLTLPSVSTHRGWVLNDSCIQHGLEALDLRVDLLVVFRQQGCQLVDDHPQSQSIVRRRAVDPFSLVLDPADFLAD